MYDLKSSHLYPENTAASHHSPKLGHTRERSAFPPPPHPPPNIPYSWHIISICHQELWLVDIIPYYRRAPSKNIPSKRKWSRGQGLFCVGLFNIVLSFTCCLQMTRRKQKGYKNQLYNMLNLVKDTHFLGKYFLKKCQRQSCTETPNYITITNMWEQKLKQIHICMESTINCR